MGSYEELWGAMGSYEDRNHFFPEGASVLRSQSAMRFPPPALPKPNVSRVFRSYQGIIFPADFRFRLLDLLTSA